MTTAATDPRTTGSTPGPDTDARAARIAGAGVTAAVVLVAAAVLAPHLFGFDPRAGDVAPLIGTWRPRVGPGTVPAVLLLLGLARYAAGWAATWSWRRLLVATWLAAAAWMVALATVDGSSGLSGVLSRHDEYLGTARSVTDLHQLLREFVSRIPLSAAPHNWPTHVAGHPPGALLFFVALVRLQLGGNMVAALVVVALAASVPAAVLVTLRRLGAEAAARAAAPFLTAGPFTVWAAVSADAMFAAVAAWGLALLAVAATAPPTAPPTAPSAARVRRAGCALAAGLLLGYCVYLSYGLPLLGLLAVAVLVVAGSARAVRGTLLWALVWALVGALAVVAAFTAAGFRWWSAYPVLSDRYWVGLAAHRPGAYWTWADLAVFAISAGPVVGAAVARSGALVVGRRVPAGLRAPVFLTLAATLSVGLAAASQMSRAEVERIWLPFVPWALTGTALLPVRWRRPALVGQLVLALVVQSLLRTLW